ncbi:hypothetical protein AWB67_07491 [Caballeronia terrestris]|uniref:Uncharacterized protein n=1 Tax=Caballeronia terrestris TaxID=1226301 RepID=A0A158L4G4_9BURK|nr:hypothetical protein AWB67_07491 [Caballeronia terrestris]
MLPFAALDLGAIEVAINIGGLVDVDIDVPATPVAVAEDRAGGGEPDAPRKSGGERGARVVGRGRRPVVRRIGRITPSAVHDGRVIRRHVDHLRIRRLDAHDGLCGLAATRRGFDDHFLLRVGLQVARVLRTRAQSLNGGEHILLLPEEGISKLLGPVELVVHWLEYLREGDERFHADVPRLALYRLYRCITLEV